MTAAGTPFGVLICGSLCLDQLRLGLGGVLIVVVGVIIVITEERQQEEEQRVIERGLVERR